MEYDLVEHLASMGGYFDEAVLKQISVKDVANEIQQLRQRVMELEADAGRYQHVRDKLQLVDELIDKAMDKQNDN